MLLFLRYSRTHVGSRKTKKFLDLTEKASTIGLGLQPFLIVKVSVEGLVVKGLPRHRNTPTRHKNRLDFSVFPFKTV